MTKFIFLPLIAGILGVAGVAMMTANDAHALTYDECLRAGGTTGSCAYLKPTSTATPYTATATATPSPVRYPDCWYRGECPGATPYAAQTTTIAVTPTATPSTTTQYPDCYARGECPTATQTTYTRTWWRWIPVPPATTPVVQDCVLRGDC